MQNNKFRIEKKSFDTMNVFYDNKQIGEFIRDLDGYYLFFANDLDGKAYSTNGNSLSFLKELADELDKVNKEWESVVNSHNLNKHLTNNFFNI
jgi:hypothetical protein